MEPVYSMTAYTVILIVALAALAMRGFTVATVGIASGIVVAAAILELTYLVRRHPARSLPHRRRLDRVVRWQWVAIGVAAAAVAVIFGATGFHPLRGAGPLVATAIIGLAVAMPTVYVSSIVDWYWILPKIAGMVGVAPCTRTGGERFAGVTKIWFFHRAAATAVVTFVLAGVPGYMAGTSRGHPGQSFGWVILGAALAIGYNSVNSGLAAAFRQSFNPQIFVGDMIRVRADPEDALMSDAYVADVSIQGLKFKVPVDVSESDPRFRDKGVLLSMEALSRTNRSRHPHAPCPNVANCRAVNWYCFRNPNANVLGQRDDAAPVPWSDPVEPRH